MKETENTTQIGLNRRIIYQLKNIKAGVASGTTGFRTRSSLFWLHLPLCGLGLWLFAVARKLLAAPRPAECWQVSSQGKERPWFVANTSTVADFELPVWHHWTSSWEEVQNELLRTWETAPAHLGLYPNTFKSTGTVAFPRGYSTYFTTSHNLCVVMGPPLDPLPWWGDYHSRGLVLVSYPQPQSTQPEHRKGLVPKKKTRVWLPEGGMPGVRQT